MLDHELQRISVFKAPDQKSGNSQSASSLRNSSDPMINRSTSKSSENTCETAEIREREDHSVEPETITATENGGLNESVQGDNMDTSMIDLWNRSSSDGQPTPGKSKKSSQTELECSPKDENIPHGFATAGAPREESTTPTSSENTRLSSTRDAASPTDLFEPQTNSQAGTKRGEEFQTNVKAKAQFKLVLPQSSRAQKRKFSGKSVASAVQSAIRKQNAEPEGCRRKYNNIINSLQSKTVGDVNEQDIVEAGTGTKRSRDALDDCPSSFNSKLHKFAFTPRKDRDEPDGASFSHQPSVEDECASASGNNVAMIKRTSPTHEAVPLPNPGRNKSVPSQNTTLHTSDKLKQTVTKQTEVDKITSLNSKNMKMNNKTCYNEVSSTTSEIGVNINNKGRSSFSLDFNNMSNNNSTETITKRKSTIRSPIFQINDDDIDDLDFDVDFSVPMSKRK